MTYRVYSRPGSGGFVVEAALSLAGLPYETLDVTRDSSDAAFLAVSPLNQVPAILLPGGGSMTESAAICIHLAEIAPGRIAPAVGDAARPAFLRWMLFISSEIYPALMKFYFPHRSTAGRDGIQAVQAASIAEADRYFEIIEKDLAGRAWVAGETMSIADVYLLMLAAWHPVADAPRPEWVNIVRVCEATRKHPVIAGMNGRHKLW
ncbi:MAG: glutathione S-transferase family protein [Rhizobiaceae bacterium]